MLTIDKIEGNSRIGVPVFSYAGRKSNYKILIFQPTYDQKKEMLDRQRVEDPKQAQIREYKQIADYLSNEKVCLFFLKIL